VLLIDDLEMLELLVPDPREARAFMRTALRHLHESAASRLEGETDGEGDEEEAEGEESDDEDR
jgi:hypothetical protein